MPFPLLSASGKKSKVSLPLESVPIDLASKRRIKDSHAMPKKLFKGVSGILPEIFEKGGIFSGGNMIISLDIRGKFEFGLKCGKRG